MNCFQVALFIIVLLLLIIAFRNTPSLRGGIMTSWTRNNYRDLVNSITEAIKEHIELDNYDYEDMRDEVKTKTKQEMQIADDLFSELKKLKMEEYDKDDIIGKAAFLATFTGLVEAYVHLYTVHGIKLHFDGSIYSGAFNIALFCNSKYVLRIRARHYNNGAELKQRFNEGAPLIKTQANNVIIQESIAQHRMILDVFRDSDYILKPICSSYVLYHDYASDLVVEWSLNDKCLSIDKMNPIQNPETLDGYIRCMLETNRIAHSVGLTYVDYKIGNILWNPKTKCYCIIDIDFEPAEVVNGNVPMSHPADEMSLLASPNYLKSNFASIDELACILLSKDYKEYLVKIGQKMLTHIPFRIIDSEFEDDELEDKIKEMIANYETYKKEKEENFI